MADVIGRLKQYERKVIPTIHKMEADGFNEKSQFITGTWTAGDNYVAVAPGPETPPASLATATSFNIPFDDFEWVAIIP